MKKVVKVLIVMVCFGLAAGVLLFYLDKKREQEEMVQQALLAIEYRQQNRALPRVEGRPEWEEVYVDYGAIDEVELYVRLVVYNEWLMEYDAEAKELTLEDFEEYLSSEYNEDGSLRVYEGYEHIRAYVDWYHEGGAEDIREYWSELEMTLADYRVQNPGKIRISVKDLNVAQLQELIKKVSNTDYQINREIMLGE